jgi:hypothetical protein
VNRGRLLIGLSLCLLVALAAIATPGLAAKAKIVPGTYTAKVTGAPGFKFKVTGYIPDKCGTRPGTYCFIALSYPKIKEPCTNGQSEGGLFAIPNGFVKTSGRFAYSQPLSSNGPLIKFVANLNGNKATGTLREKDQYDDGTGTLIPCDSGTLHWTAKRK